MENMTSENIYRIEITETNLPTQQNNNSYKGNRHVLSFQTAISKD